MMSSVVINNINRIIREKGLKKYYIAERSGMSLQQFSNILNERRHIKTEEIPVIATALEVTPNDLFGFVSKVD